jgi:hypothetical protein
MLKILLVVSCLVAGLITGFTVYNSEPLSPETLIMMYVGTYLIVAIVGWVCVNNPYGVIDILELFLRFLLHVLSRGATVTVKTVTVIGVEGAKAASSVAKAASSVAKTARR